MHDSTRAAASRRVFPAPDRRYRALLALIVAIGLGLRIAGAQGGLWLDEAWSAVLAHEVGTPLGIFVGINHDNNHFLNSLWMQAMGFAAPSPLLRGLSIATGTAAILVAERIGARRGALTALVTATLFAVSPVLVTFGSEARGYAPMALALLVAILLVDRWLAGESARSPATALGLCFFLGALAQLTILFGFCAIAGWVFFTLWRRSSFGQALAATFRLLLGSAVALALVLAMIAAAAMTHQGFKFGAYDSFTWIQFLHGISTMFEYALGFPVITVWWFALVPALVILAPGLGVTRMAFHRLAILAFPLTLALLHAGNVAHPRYYLLAGIALLILVAEMIGHGLRAGGRRRALAGTAFVAILAGSLVQDVDLAVNRRGDTSAAIRALQARAPGGARILVDRETARAQIEVGAAQARYPVTILTAGCPDARFLLADRFQGETPPPTYRSCGSLYLPVETRRAHGLSGTNWTLYERRP